MAHLIRARDIPMVERRPHMTAYLDQVRRALLDPSLPPHLRARLEARLTRIRMELRGPPPAQS